MLMQPKYSGQLYQTVLPLPIPGWRWNGHRMSKTFLVLASFNSHKRRQRHISSSSSPAAVVRAVAKTEKEVDATAVTTVKAVLTVKVGVGSILSGLTLSRGLDDIADLFGRSLFLELVAAHLAPETGEEKETIKGYAHKAGQDDDELKYEAEFTIPNGFGEIGAVLVENEHHREMHLKSISLEGLPHGPIHFSCNSWLHSKFDNPQKRVFFSNKLYLPSETPDGLKRLREEELVTLRGNGKGERKKFERIYDYDVYNDLGDPDDDPDNARPIIGGDERPYPRRCRTGRPRSSKDPLTESRGGNVYVPRDEAFSEVKSVQFSATTLYSALHAVVPFLQSSLDADASFPHFTAIDTLFNEGFPLSDLHQGGLSLTQLIPRLIKTLSDTRKNVLQFETPQLYDRDKFSWYKDEEFGRQTLAGLNPCSIKLVTEWPLKSKLDPEVYGSPESEITKELVEQAIRGFMTVEEAVEQKRLFMLDYHDLLLPYVKKVRAQNISLYGSRTLFFLTNSGTLRPLAIELTRPPVDDKSQWKQVFTPTWDATGGWLWKLAKAHVLSHDSGFHQLVSHWLRTHCATEPYIIATNRQLSAMHPIYRLLHPHFRYTLEINALARQALINAGGIIESSFAPGTYSVELSSVAYDQLWRFDQQALPADLISRGMAVEDPSAPHGLSLTIKDYPYANDGLLIWDAIKQWVTDYVNHYYPEADLVKSDNELQAWWKEIRTVGHGDKKDEPWWPSLENPKDLIDILTTIIWVPSAHHAAVNFGQYDFGGYIPNRPTIARTKMPTEDFDRDEWQRFLEGPEDILMECFPSQMQATIVMTILDLLSTHSPDEEYLGENTEPHWAGNPVISAAFERLNGRLKEIEGIIDHRNTADANFKNRMGAGVLPYQLLKPFSEAGVTMKGIPNSISI